MNIMQKQIVVNIFRVAKSSDIWKIKAGILTNNTKNLNILHVKKTFKVEFQHDVGILTLFTSFNFYT